MADFTENDVYEALGLGVQEQELAAPAENPETEHTDTGEQEQEPAAPAESAEENASAGSTQSTADTAEEKDQEEETGEEHQQQQTPEQRRENAARRRQAELQQAVDKAVAAALNEERQKNDAALKDFFAKAGLKNTMTGEPITTMEQFQVWNAAFEQAKLDKELQSGKLTAEGLATAIGNHPIIKQAQALLEQNINAQKVQADAAAKEAVKKEIAEIHKIDESINSVEDLLNAPYGKELYAMVQKGYTISDAHYLLNRERLEQAKAEAIRQQSMNNARSKGHLTATNTPRGAGSITVPQADMEMFRLFNPTATDAEILKYYNDVKKGG